MFILLVVRGSFLQEILKGIFFFIGDAVVLNFHFFVLMMKVLVLSLVLIQRLYELMLLELLAF